MKAGRTARRLGAMALVLAGSAFGRDDSAAVRRGSAALERFEFVAPQMGTLFKVALYAPDAARAEEAAQAAFARVRELNRVFSDYDPDSEAMRLCRQPAGVARPVSPELLTMLVRSQRLAERSAGAFDVTVGPLVRLWREARRTRRLPAEAELAAARQASGYRWLRVDEAGGTVTLLAGGMILDFGGIAKGYAADQALAVLRRRGLPRAMVAASGDLALGDAPPGTPGWRVAVEPFGRTGAAPRHVVAANVGISTSGDAEQFVEIGGVRYSHIVDPGTGLGLTVPVAVAVVAPSGERADSLATACSVLAATDQARIPGLVGDGAGVLVLRRGSDGAIGSTVFGAPPPGVRSGW